MNRFIALILSLCATWAFASADKIVTGPDGQQFHTGLLIKPNQTGVVRFEPAPILGLPDAYDSKADGFVFPIRDQKSCGSCWAFAMTRAFEFSLASSGRGTLDLSEQDWVSNANQHDGCSGGYMDASFAVDTGVLKEADCPYKARDGVRCATGERTKAIRWGFVGAEGRKPTVDELKAAIFQYKAVAVDVAAGNGLGNAGSDGSVRCNDRGINHMVTLTGWHADGKFIMDNSWGESYGDNGRAYLKQGCDELAANEDSALYIVSADGPVVPANVMLPAEITIHKGTTLALGVQAEAGVDYKWSPGGETASMLFVAPTADTTYSLEGKNIAGTATSSVIVKVIE